MDNCKQSVLRPVIVLPSDSLSGYLKTSEARLAFDALQDKIWRELLKHLRQPIKHVPSKKHRIVEVLGCIRYYINHNTGEINSSVRDNGRHFKPLIGKFSVDPPFHLTSVIFKHFINEWKDELLLISDNKQFSVDFANSLLRAVRLSVYLKQLRYQIFDALKINPETIAIARQARIVRHARTLHNEHFNLVVRHLEDYKQLQSDAPNLLWLYTLVLHENFELPEGELVQALKALSLASGCNERGWRFISKSHLRNFEPALEYGGAAWSYLVQYVRLHNALDRNFPIPRKSAHLFIEPSWHIKSDGTIDYRNVNLQPALLNSYIDEATKQKDINSFMTSDATSVFVWLSQAKPKFDSNQLKSGWSWLLREANDWLLEQAAHAKLISVSWSCGLGEIVLGNHKFTPLTNAWQVRQEALRYRHCVDNFIEQCVNGTYRIYSVYDNHDKHKATLGLQYTDYRGWHVNQIRGFANTTVSASLNKKAHSVSDGLNIVNEGVAGRSIPTSETKTETPLYRCSNLRQLFKDRPMDN